MQRIQHDNFAQRLPKHRHTNTHTQPMIIGNEITTISITLVNINWFWQLDSLRLPSYSHSIYHNLSSFLTFCLKTTKPDVDFFSFRVCLCMCFFPSCFFVIVLECIVVRVSISPWKRHHHQIKKQSCTHFWCSSSFVQTVKKRWNRITCISHSNSGTSSDWAQIQKNWKIAARHECRSWIKLFFIIFLSFSSYFAMFFSDFESCLQEISHFK